MQKDQSGCEKSILDNLKIAAPCPANWDEMVGTERERFCNSCALNVYNISAMSRSEAEEFLALKGGNRVCVQFYRRHDGTVLTDNCPKGLRKLRNQGKRFLKAACAFFVLILTGQAAGAGEDNATPTETPAIPSAPVKIPERGGFSRTSTLRGPGQSEPRAFVQAGEPSYEARHLDDGKIEETYQAKLKCQLEAKKPDAAGIARARADLAFFYRARKDYKRSINEYSQAADKLRRLRRSATEEDKLLLSNILLNWATTERLNNNSYKAETLEGEAKERSAQVEKDRNKSQSR